MDVMPSGRQPYRVPSWDLAGAPEHPTPAAPIQAKDVLEMAASPLTEKGVDRRTQRDVTPSAHRGCDDAVVTAFGGDQTANVGPHRRHLDTCIRGCEGDHASAGLRTALGQTDGARLLCSE